MKRILFCAMLIGLMTGCSVYHPLKDGEGYVEEPVGPNSFQVTFVGGSSLSATETREYCLTRAAELAVLHDDPYFRIVDEHLTISIGQTYYPGSYYPAYGYGYGGRRRGIYYREAYYDPGYLETYSIPEVTMRIAFEKQMGDNSIPAAFFIDRAVDQKLKLTDGVVDRAAGMPRAGGGIPPPPMPKTQPALQTPATHPG